MDTGFNGFLTLPGELVESLGARRLGNAAAKLGDGRDVMLPCFETKLATEEPARRIVALGADGPPLVEMSLLRDHRLTIDVWEGGAVSAVSRDDGAETARVSISYRLTGPGWSECTLSAGDDACVVSASYISDPLGDLARSTIAMLNGGYDQTVTFLEEPGEYQWRLRRMEHELHIQVLWFRDWTELIGESGGEVRMDSLVRWQDFVMAVYAALGDVLFHWGIDGYRAAWVNADFPLEEFARLRSASQKQRG